MLLLPPSSTGHRALDTGALWEGLHRGQVPGRRVIRDILEAGCHGPKVTVFGLKSQRQEAGAEIQCIIHEVYESLKNHV